LNDVIVTAATQPTLFLALEAISHDRGSGAGHSNYAIPAGWQFFIYPAERALKLLTPKEFAEFTIGEHEVAQEIAHRTQELHMAHRLLEAFFMDFEDGMDVPS
jgi:hypothetical protein